MRLNAEAAKLFVSIFLATTSAATVGQINSVNQLGNVTSNYWAYTAIRSLAERYGCVAGFPDQTFKGNKPMTREEFAAGLNQCYSMLEKLKEIDKIPKEDEDLLRKASIDFERELTQLNGARQGR